MVQTIINKEVKMPSQTPYAGQRLEALDLFRGLTVAAMILVNNPGDWSTTYAPLLHVKWNGCTLTDLIFPFFLFIVGMAIPLALGKPIKDGQEKSVLALKILRRGLTIFALGVFLTGFPNFGLSGANSHLIYHYSLLAVLLFALFYREIAKQKQFQESLTMQRWSNRFRYLLLGGVVVLVVLALIKFLPYGISHIHLPGVLQRIAEVYVVCALLHLYSSWRMQLVVGIGILLIYWEMMMFLPVPGYGHANLDPVHNLATWIDRFLINGLYFMVTGKAHHLNQFQLDDPEGFFTTIPAITTTIIGMLAGRWLLGNNNSYKKAAGILVTGVILVGIGLLWNLEFPINKKLWSSSFVLYSGGVALLTFGVIYWLRDILGYLSWTKPALVFGTNALFIYLLSEMATQVIDNISWEDANGHFYSLQTWLFQTFFSSWLPAYRASLLYAMIYVLLFWSIAWFLNHKKIFIKV